MKKKILLCLMAVTVAVPAHAWSWSDFSLTDYLARAKDLVRENVVWVLSGAVGASAIGAYFVWKKKAAEKEKKRLAEEEKQKQKSTKNTLVKPVSSLGLPQYFPGKLSSFQSVQLSLDNFPEIRGEEHRRYKRRFEAFKRRLAEIRLKNTAMLCAFLRKVEDFFNLYTGAAKDDPEAAAFRKGASVLRNKAVELCWQSSSKTFIKWFRNEEEKEEWSQMNTSSRMKTKSEHIFEGIQYEKALAFRIDALLRDAPYLEKESNKVVIINSHKWIFVSWVWEALNRAVAKEKALIQDLGNKNLEAQIKEEFYKLYAHLSQSTVTSPHSSLPPLEEYWESFMRPVEQTVGRLDATKKYIEKVYPWELREGSAELFAPLVKLREELIFQRRETAKVFEKIWDSLAGDIQCIINSRSLTPVYSAPDQPSLEEMDEELKDAKNFSAKEKSGEA